ncbi:hypothetical protein CBS147343_6270 [Aspergillus niger]|uniref:NmrA-like domain-containing protein n=1 Tax=Aspergillus niger TaxID=5061 RepID=A0A9W6ADF6_ASPNG|nr:hypothetical protein CBS11350_6110 [Aspergillus niger]KAI2860367.1 hypothetical protein CBS12448_5208 [Aspergillus niger]KAI2907362.1 hypothetical protein CBS147371_10658 [Aspergillus niger]KAI2934464.1 hypothetical protein CBS147320_1040 [Aspergillus niger]KAI2947282.1 hypothetical protein CBS147321_2906 [Aspergillus niger]
MAPTILIVGATGNTGRAVTETLPTLLKANENFKNHRVLALTRSLTSSSAQLIAKIPGVEIIEKNWTDITSDWLREHEVVRAFIASHNAPNQFAEESAFHVAALGAGVEYVVRISTTAPNVRPDYAAYYPRSHWAIEAMLGSAEFSALKWTSLQPNVFLNFYMALVAEYIKQYKRTGELGPLKLMASKDAPVAPIHPDEVGVFAAHLLALDNPSPHSGAKYVLNGPEDITGEQLVGLVEKHIDTKVKDVKYQDLSFLDAMLGSQYEGSGESMTVIKSIKYAPLTMWEGKCNASTTSKEVLDIAPPRRTPTEVLEDLLKA